METASSSVAVAPLFSHVPLSLCTSLARLKAAGACATGYAKFRRHIRATLPFVTDDDPVPLAVALDCNPIGDVLWGFRHATCGPRPDRLLRELACDFAEHVLPLFEKRRPDDKRPRECIEVARRYARGEATDDERREARAAADAADAAYAAAADAADAAAAAYAAAADAAAADAAAAAAAADAAAAAYAAAAAAAAYAAYAAAAAAERAWQTEHFRAALAAACSPAALPKVGEQGAVNADVPS